MCRGFVCDVSASAAAIHDPQSFLRTECPPYILLTPKAELQESAATCLISSLGKPVKIPFLFTLTIDMRFFRFSPTGSFMPSPLLLGTADPVNLHAIRITHVCSLMSPKRVHQTV
jgi:hypothetical protein